MAQFGDLDYMTQKQLVDTLADAKLQIEYLQEKFQETGTGNAVIARLERTLQDIENGEL